MASPLRLDSGHATDACTAPPHPATMTRLPSPSRSTTSSPSPASGSRWFQRTHALLMTDADDAPCSETDCLPARAASLLSTRPQRASQELRAIACTDRLLLRMAT